MHVREMTDRECWSTLAAARLGRLACALENQPYIVPISFVVNDELVYSFALPGQKIDWMRRNPRVCLEVDDVRQVDQWTSVVADGRYEELSSPFDREQAHALLQQRPMWWQPGAAARAGATARARPEPIFYRIRVERITGFIGMPAESGHPGAPATHGAARRA
jgi:nitroimidazol reductase NimA-like FMN-containing flavoprotein (pyridoxamine 5'-phosphate oxidase superfamily)